MTPGQIHGFWFGEALTSLPEATRRMKFWFSSSADTDALIRDRFAPILHDAGRNALARWEDDPHACLALIIVLDQFARNIHRGTAAAFQHDALALAVARRGVEHGYLEHLHMLEQSFLLMPFQHSEGRSAQREGLVLFERIAVPPAPGWMVIAQEIVHFARLHCEIVERFGRFPHRNPILRRKSTPEEEAYLASNGQSFGQNVRSDPPLRG